MKRIFSQVLKRIRSFWLACEDAWASQDIANLVLPEQVSPLLLIPGSSATENRFNGLVRNLQRQTRKMNDFIRIKVWNDGRISYKGQLKPSDQQPIMVVGFQNNRDGYANIKKQAQMLNQLFKILQEKQSFKEFKAVGHSNGGLIASLFLEKYLPSYAGISCHKLLTIGTPYNFNEKDSAKQSQMLLDFIAGSQALSRDLTVLSVLGRLTSHSDGIVPHASVQAGRLIFDGRVQSYREIVLTGTRTHHSQLPQNQDLIDLIRKEMVD